MYCPISDDETLKIRGTCLILNAVMHFQATYFENVFDLEQFVFFEDWVGVRVKILVCHDAHSLFLNIKNIIVGEAPCFYPIAEVRQNEGLI